MKTFVSILKYAAILAVAALVAYVLYQVVKAVRAGADAASAARAAIAKAASSAKSVLTPGWSSTVPTRGDMPSTMAAEWDKIKAGEPNLNTPNPNAPWWQKPPSIHNVFGIDLAPATKTGTGGTTNGGTPQTLGTAQNSVNLDPYAIRNQTPSNQTGDVTAQAQLNQGSSGGTANMLGGSGNVMPTPSNNIGPVAVHTTDTTALADLNYIAPGAGAAAGSTGANVVPQGGEPDYSQNQFIGQ